MDITSIILLIAWCALDLVIGAKFELYYKSSGNWSVAKEFCEQRYRRLAKIDSESDQKWVETLEPYIKGFFWIGARGEMSSDDFLWTDSSGMEYTNWAEGFPGTTEGLDCVRIRHFDFKWETFNCSGELTYLCEDPYHRESYTVKDETKIKGIMMGFGIIGGVLLLCCLLLQLPCCRYSVTHKISRFGFGTKEHEKKRPLS